VLRRAGIVLLFLALTTGLAEIGWSQITQAPLTAQYLLPSLGTRFHHTRMDCSHFVNYLYRKAHLPYSYANSRQLYKGIEGFERVYDPLPGDLIVWRGHVGIVTDPGANRFLSVLRSGVKTDNYYSPYWRRRGKPHFLRYVGVGTAPVLAQGAVHYGSGAE